MIEGKHISFLLGAGFSKPMGYPLGNEINKHILHFSDYESDFFKNDFFQQNKKLNTLAYQLCRQIINIYENYVEIDYEKFYDYINDDMLQSPICKCLVEKYKGDFSDIKDNNLNLQDSILNIYNLIVLHFIKDSKGRQWYSKDEKIELAEIKPYENILETIKNLSHSNVINIHTLNHDLLFESFNTIGPLKNLISDGFSIEESPYFGQDQTIKPYKETQLKRFIGDDNSYFTNVRLYKLHGSIDFYWYNNVSSDKYRECMIRKDKNVEPSSLRKKDGEIIVSRSPFEFFPHILTGTTSKFRQYARPFNNQMMQSFQNNLDNSDILIIIGYGFKDECINCMIAQHFQGKNKNILIISPDAYENTNISNLLIKRKNITNDADIFELIPTKIGADEINFQSIIQKHLIATL